VRVVVNDASVDDGSLAIEIALSGASLKTPDTLLIEKKKKHLFLSFYERDVNAKFCHERYSNWGVIQGKRTWIFGHIPTPPPPPPQPPPHQQSLDNVLNEVNQHPHLANGAAIDPCAVKRLSQQ
jgi:hypothetical protein